MENYMRSRSVSPEYNPEHVGERRRSAFVPVARGDPSHQEPLVVPPYRGVPLARPQQRMPVPHQPYPAFYAACPCRNMCPLCPEQGGYNENNLQLNQLRIYPASICLRVTNYPARNVQQETYDFLAETFRLLPGFREVYLLPGYPPAAVVEYGTDQEVRHARGYFHNRLISSGHMLRVEWACKAQYQFFFG